MIEKKADGREFKEWLREQRKTLPPSATRFVLEALIPYSNANMALAFKPGVFFNELSRRETKRAYALGSLRRAYYEAKQRGLIIDESGQPQLSDQGRKALQPYEPVQMSGADILVIFDIPEEERGKRQWLRLLLRELKFQKIQQSVWMTQYECQDLLHAGLKEKHLEGYVQIFEARHL